MLQLQTEASLLHKDGKSYFPLVEACCPGLGDDRDTTLTKLNKLAQELMVGFRLYLAHYSGNGSNTGYGLDDWTMLIRLQMIQPRNDWMIVTCGWLQVSC